MFRKIMVVALLVCLMALPATAQTIDGEGWWETGYSGEYCEVPQDWRMAFKLPYDWALLDYSGSVSYFERNSGDMSLAISWIDENFWEYTDVLSNEYAYEYDECANIILGDDLDWWIGVTPTSMIAVCPGSDRETSLCFDFEMNGSPSDFTLARMMVSSVMER